MNLFLVIKVYRTKKDPSLANTKKWFEILGVFNSAKEIKKAYSNQANAEYAIGYGTLKLNRASGIDTEDFWNFKWL